MRICICTTHNIKDKFSGGVNRILEMSQKVTRKNGVEVIIVDADHKTYYILANGELTSIPLPSCITFVSKVNTFQYFIKQTIGRLIAPPYEFSHISSCLNFFLLIKLRYLSSLYEFDVLQAEFPSAMGICLLYKKIFRKRIPLVYSEHNIEYIRVTRQNCGRFFCSVLRKLEEHYWNVADAVIVVSQLDRQTLLDCSIAPNKIILLPNAVDCESFVHSQISKEIRDKMLLSYPTLVFHGSFDYVSNKEAADIILSKILPKLSERGRPVTMLFIGKNSPSPKLSGVVSAGPVTELPPYLDAADIAIVPLKSGAGTRIKILEYMAMGKPIVSTNVGAEGINVTHGYNIMLADDEDEFVDAIEFFIHNPEKASKIGANARETAELYYDWNKNTENLFNAYKKVM